MRTTGADVVACGVWLRRSAGPPSVTPEQRGDTGRVGCPAHLQGRPRVPGMVGSGVTARLAGACAVLYCLAVVRALDAFVHLAAVRWFSSVTHPEASERASHFATMSLFAAALCGLLGLGNRLNLELVRIATRWLGGLVIGGFVALVVGVTAMNSMIGPKVDARIIRNGTALPDAYLWAVAVISLVAVLAVIILLAPVRNKALRAASLDAGGLKS